MCSSKANQIKKKLQLYNSKRKLNTLICVPCPPLVVGFSTFCLSIYIMIYLIRLTVLPYYSLYKNFSASMRALRYLNHNFSSEIEVLVLFWLCVLIWLNIKTYIHCNNNNISERRLNVTSKPSSDFFGIPFVSYGVYVHINVGVTCYIPVKTDRWHLWPCKPSVRHPRSLVPQRTVCCSFQAAEIERLLPSQLSC